MLDGDEIGLSVTAAPSISDFNDTWATPGVFFGVTDQFDITTEDLLDAYDFSESCTLDSRTPYSDLVYTGSFDVWTDCDGTGTMLVVVGVQPEDGSYLGLVVVQVVSEADLEALDRVIESFIWQQ